LTDYYSKMKIKVEFKNEDAMNRVVSMLWGLLGVNYEIARWRTQYVLVPIRRN